MKLVSREKTIQHASVWIGAFLVGLAAVGYARTVSYIQGRYFLWFSKSPYLIAAAMPFFFVLATALVRKFAPDAKGSGIPQVLEAIELADHPGKQENTWRSSLVSIRTAVFKVLSSLFGLFGGASIGREGPTVQISASIFAAIGRAIRKHAGNVKLPSYLTAGAAAGVAAAFNTPIAGIAFAIEEVITGSVTSFRQYMMLAVIISGITAQAMIGNYLYFGRPEIQAPDLTVVYQAILIGVSGGFFGGCFARMLAYPKVMRLPSHWVTRSFLCGLGCAILCALTHGATAGSGYEITERLLTAPNLDDAPVLFPIYKIGATTLSYLSGMAGGIFSPSLSVGAGIGISMAKIFHFTHFRTCALTGMVAYFSGVVQAPLTAVIIVTEMTDRHELILPFMIAAFVGQAVGKRFLPEPLYHFLAKRKVEG